jgi:CubicO group peptidase (beta-lactamase class C family)
MVIVIHMKKLLLMSLGLVSLTGCYNETAESDQDKYGNPVMTEDFSSIDSLMDCYIKEDKIQGCVALVSHKGKLVFHNALGYSNIGEQRKQSLDDIFRIASMTKPITVVGAMILYDEGKFELDDPVGKYIPEYKSMEILQRVDMSDSSYTSYPAVNAMTIRHLLTHTSGSYYASDNDTLWAIYTKNGITEGFEERDILLADNVKRLGKLPILHEPGERFTYGLSMDILGRLIEIWSGQPLDKFLKERIFNPLGMNDTYFNLPESKHDRLVPVYKSSDNGIVPTDYPLINYPVSGAKKYLSGGGDLNCTAYDYYLFCRMMLNKGQLNGAKILEPETVDLITSTQFERGDNDMGLGVSVLSAKDYVKDARSIGSYSWGGFFTTTFWIDPAEELIAILMLQMYPFDSWDIQRKFENIIYESAAVRSTPALTPSLN